MYPIWFFAIFYHFSSSLICQSGKWQSRGNESRGNGIVGEMVKSGKWKSRGNVSRGNGSRGNGSRGNV